MPDSSPATPQSLNDALVETYLRYIDTAYWLRDERLMRERRQRLVDSGILATEPFLEPILTYPAKDLLSEVAREMGIDASVAEQVGQVLFGAYTTPGEPIRLRAHQAAAVRASFKNGAAEANIVVTSGTGSGKTESFLPAAAAAPRCRSPILGPPAGAEPVVDDQLMDARDQPAQRRDPAGCTAGDDRLSNKRPGRGPDVATAPGRPCAGRPRSAPVVRQADRGEPRQRRPPNPPSSAQRTVKDVRMLVEEYDAMRAAPVPEGDSLEERLALFTDPRRNEMVVRWDMVQAPPDILVTNFSMLNVVLMRDVEANLFGSTRAWLEADPANVFTLVVDELHLHRGTSGSEVGMVLRNLLARLGLPGDSQQLRSSVPAHPSPRTRTSTSSSSSACRGPRSW